MSTKIKLLPSVPAAKIAGMMILTIFISFFNPALAQTPSSSNPLSPADLTNQGGASTNTGLSQTISGKNETELQSTSPEKATNFGVPNLAGCVSYLTSNAVIGVGSTVGGTAASAAVVPVHDALNTFQTSQIVANTNQLTAKELCYDSLAYYAAKVMIRILTANIVEWIQSGFEGSPGFVTDLEGFLLNTAEAVVGDFIASAFGDLGDIICKAFDLQLRISLINEFQSGFAYGAFGSRINCPISLNFGVHVDVNGEEVFGAGGEAGADFAFSNGWDSWYDTTQNDGGNFYGAYLAAFDEASSRRSQAKATEVQKLNWSGGFLSVDKCIAYSVDDPTRCVEKETATPGKLVASQLEDVFGQNIRQLELADEFNEIFNALVNQLITMAMSETGLLGINSTSIEAEKKASIETYKAAQRAPDQLPIYNFDGDLIYGPQSDRQNIAIGRSTQSSRTVQNDPGKDSGKAVDGIKNDVVDEYRHAFVSQRAPSPFIEIDLGERDTAIGAVEITPVERYYNSLISAETALGHFRIFVYNPPKNSPNLDPFPANFDPLDPGTWKNAKNAGGNDLGTTVLCDVCDINVVALQRTQRGTQEIVSGAYRIPVYKLGRYIRIQRIDGTQAAPVQLMVDEVEVFPNLRPVIELSKVTDPVTKQLGTTLVLNVGDQYRDPPGTTVTDIDPVRHDPTNYMVKPQTIDTSAPGQYTLEYNATDIGGAKADTKRRRVIVQLPPPTAVLKINGNEVVVVIGEGQTITAEWSSQFADKCIPSAAPAIGGWDGELTPSGSKQLSIPTNGQFYINIQCGNTSGTATKSVVANVNGR